MKPRLAIVNARVWTGETERPWADAVAVEGERIASVGSSSAIRKLLPAGARVIDAGGGLLVPGFTDAHIHFLEGGYRLSWISLRAAAGREDFRQMLSDFADGIRPPQWILGGDWDHQNWGGELPSREWIDAVTRENPVWLTRHDGHMGLANSKALELAGVNSSTASPPGGVVVRDSDGDATGILKDRAMELITAVVPARTERQQDDALAAAMRYVAARGVTEVHHMGSWDDLEVFRRARDRGAMLTRIYAAVPLRTWERLRDEIASGGRGDAWLRIGAMKEFVDGSLGSRTALFFDDYDDLPSERGLLVSSESELLELIMAADAAGLQCMTHAIGDRANRILLDIYERVATVNGSRDRRFRVEHAQHLTLGDIPRFAAQGVIASVQPYHAIDDGRWLQRSLGARRAATSFAFRSLLDSGARLAMGSDWFVAPPSPLLGIYAAVTRRTLDDANPDGWIPEERITVEAALRAYTMDAAYAGFGERDRGSISPGKLADLALMDRDITAMDPGEIADTKVILTIAGGRIAFDESDPLLRTS